MFIMKKKEGELQFGGPAFLLGGDDASGGNSWSPLALSSQTVGWWDSSFGVSLSGSAVTAWADRKAGYSATQGVGALRPDYSATGFNGVPGLTFDGADDYLECVDAAFLAALPSGAAAGEIWAVVQQDDVATDTTVRIIGGYGGATSASRRAVERSVNVGVNRPRVAAGDGATAITVSNAAVAMDTRHVIRGIFTPTTIRADIDGIAGSTTAVVPATTNTRVRFGAISNTSPSNCLKGKLRHLIFISGLLTGTPEALMTQWALSQRML